MKKHTSVIGSRTVLRTMLVGALADAACARMGTGTAAGEEAAA